MQLIREERAGDRGLKQTHRHIKKKVGCKKQVASSCTTSKHPVDPYSGTGRCLIGHVRSTFGLRLALSLSVLEARKPVGACVALS